MPRLRNRGRHALKDIITQNEVVEERSGGVTRDQEAECARTQFMDQFQCGPQLLLGHQLWNLPQEYSELASPQ
jgi:hypothetical protein